MPIAAIGSVLGGLLGFGGSIAPAVLDIYDKKQERAHVEKMKGIEIEAAKLGQQFVLQGQEIAAESAETTALLAHDTSLESGSKWLESIRASVRPVITYAFFGLFLLVKLAALYVAFVVQSVPLSIALISIWDGDTAAIFAAVIGFWFGNRSINKFGYAESIVSRPGLTGISYKSSLKPTTK